EPGDLEGGNEVAVALARLPRQRLGRGLGRQGLLGESRARHAERERDGQAHPPQRARPRRPHFLYATTAPSPFGRVRPAWPPAPPSVRTTGPRRRARPRAPRTAAAARSDPMRSPGRRRRADAPRPRARRRG